VLARNARSASGPSATARRFERPLEDRDPGLAVAALNHLGDVAERFPVALFELDAGPVVAQCGESTLSAFTVWPRITEVANLPLGHQLPMSMNTVNAFSWLHGTSMVFTRGSIMVALGSSSALGAGSFRSSTSRRRDWDEAQPLARHPERRR
jgi:hypothetical protein